MKNLTTLIVLLLCFTISNAQKRIKGNGNVVTIKRTTSDYDALRIGGFYEVTLVEGIEGNITLKGEDNILEYIETDVKGRTLIIKSRDNKNLKPSQGEGIYITVPAEKINAIRLSGSGKVVSKNILDMDNLKIRTSGSRYLDLSLDSKNVSITTSGSSNISLKGSSDNLHVTTSGSSIINAYELEVEDAKMVLSGSSRVRVTVNKEIDARVSGSGNISYQGNPEKINTKISGSGSVSKN